MVLFTTLSYICIFLPITLLLFLLVPQRGKPGLLLGISVAFLAISDLYAGIFFLCITLLTLLYSRISLLLRRKRRILLRLYTMLQLAGYLCALVLWQFWVQRKLAPSGDPLHFLPFGGAFFLLQAIGYVISVYRDANLAKQPVLHVLLYHLFYPPLVMGPVQPFAQFQRSLLHLHWSSAQVGSGMICLVRGLAKKVLLADSLWKLFLPLYETSGKETSLVLVWVSLFGLVLAFYLTVWGYAEMAEGIALCYGIRLPQSYTGSPLFAGTLTRFSQQWNKTVVAWFQRYTGTLSSAGGVLGSACFWGLLGLWYRPTWETLFWGIWLGIWIGMDVQLQTTKQMQRIPLMLQRMLFVLVTSIGWAIFFSPDLAAGLDRLATMFGIHGRIFWKQDFYHLQSSFLLLLISLYVGSGHFPRLLDKLRQRRWAAVLCDVLRIPGTALLLLLSVWMIAGQSGLQPLW